MSNQNTNMYAAPLATYSNDDANPRSPRSNRSLTLNFALGTLAGFAVLMLLGDKIHGNVVLATGALLVVPLTVAGGLITCLACIVELVECAWHLQGIRLCKVIAGIGLLIIPVMVESSRPKPQALYCNDINNLKQIGLAMLNYESAHQHFPTACGSGGKGEGLSWRVHILPYIEHDELYKRFRLDEPWDSPHNLALIPEMPDDFLSLSVEANVPAGKTLFLRPLGNGALASGDGSKTKFTHITDGTSNTVLVFQVNPSAAVAWTRPLDCYFDPSNPRRALGNEYRNGRIMTSFADGSVSCFYEDLSDQDLKAVITRSGGEEVSSEIW